MSTSLDDSEVYAPTMPLTFGFVIEKALLGSGDGQATQELNFSTVLRVIKSPERR